MQSLNVTPTVLPYIAPRKSRKQESFRFVVKWTDACNFMDQLIDDGFQARVLMK